MPYMDTIACAILFEASMSLAAPDVKKKKKDIKRRIKKIVVKAWSGESCLKCCPRLARKGP